MRSEGARTEPFGVPVADAVDPPRAIADGLALQPMWLAMSIGVRSRALWIVQTVAQEASLRGHDLRLRTDDVLGFRVVVRGELFDFTLSEEADLVDVIPDEEVAATKYPWQRVSLRIARVPSGRLALKLESGYRHWTWADRTRWRLDGRLDHALAHIEELADQAHQARIATRDQARLLRQAWDEAITLARERYVEAFNRGRMESQLASWERATALRSYGERLAVMAAGETDPERAARIADWRRRIDDEANRIDPLATPDDQEFVRPSQIGAAELDPFMPKGMSASRPPIVPD